QEAKKKNIQWKIDLTMDGYNGNPPASGPWDPDSVYRTLAWFRDNAVGIPVGVMLKHYSTVAPGYPPTVDVDPGVFVQLKDLYSNFWEARSIYNSLPEVYKNQLRQRFDNFIQGVIANRQNLPTDLNARARLADSGNELIRDLRVHSARKAFYNKLLGKR